VNVINGHRRVRIVFHGIVQGVGFRPFVYRLANELHIAGWVSNSPSGVIIEAEADDATLNTFLTRLQAEKPPHSFIQNSEAAFLEPIGYKDFSIHESNVGEEKTTLILPDIAVCEECLREMLDPSNHRYRYPFINCTHCGPRFSIIEALPYDRPNTTMKMFAMCPECEAEYHNPADRRFHAQPIACPKCGPHLELWDREGKIISAHDDALMQAVAMLSEGVIIALKGLGGFQLLVDATNEEAVQRLRQRKQREEKPFAVMFPSLSEAKKVCDVSELEAQLLISSESPIVLLNRKSKIENAIFRHLSQRDFKSIIRNPQSVIAEAVAPGNPYLGVMLPYTPLHHLLMSEISFPVVATSGNISDEPMCIDEYDALKKLGGIADFFLVHNRPIHRYVDDSVVRVVLNREMIVRRARGYAPLPIQIQNVTSTLPDRQAGFTVEKENGTSKSILAVGGHLKNTVALQKGENIFLSQHIGDLETAPALECFKNTIDDFVRLYEAKPVTILHDAHPNYVSTSYAQQLSTEATSYQHHFAHIASCMADNELNESVLGVSWDGTGYGLDCTQPEADAPLAQIWGGEFAEFDGKTFKRVATMKPFRLPGGDAAVKESIRSAVGMLHEVIGKNVFAHRIFSEKFSEQEKRLLLQMMEKKINSPLTSSVGRMFDALGALLGLRTRASFEGQTAMEVEFAAYSSTDTACYPFYFIEENPSLLMINWEPMLQRILGDINEKQNVFDIARRFHNTLVEMIVATAQRFDRKNIVLSGGCFQNALLLEQSVNRLQEEGFTPYWHRRIPTNDGGISVGQIYMRYLEACRKKNECLTVSSFMSLSEP